MRVLKVAADAVEVQHHFLLKFLAPFLCEVHAPLATRRNPRPQDDDLPDDLIIGVARPRVERPL